MSKKYYKPKIYSYEYALHGPCIDGKTYSIPTRDLGDVEPNFQPIEYFENTQGEADHE